MRASGDGLTLVEVLVALAVTAVVMSMFSAFGQAMTMLRLAQHRTVGVAFAARYLDVTRDGWRDPSAFARATLPAMSPPPEFSCEVSAGETWSACAQGAHGVDPDVVPATRSAVIRLQHRSVRVELGMIVAAPFTEPPGETP